MEELIIYDVGDIASMLHCGLSHAYGVIRAIKKVCGGGKLTRARVLKSEFDYWISRPKIQEKEENPK